jgi:hypothetical protein
VITVVIFVTREAGTGSWSFLVGGGDLAASLELAHDPLDDLASVGGEAENDQNESYVFIGMRIFGGMGKYRMRKFRVRERACNL